MDKEILEKLRQLNEDDDKERLPDRELTVRALKLLQTLLFPDYFHFCSLTDPQQVLSLTRNQLKDQMTAAYALAEKTADIDTIIDEYVGMLPEIKRVLLTDIQAIYDGDPAATSKQEVIITYPGFYAILAYRLAHGLYRLGVPIIPRIMTEYVHGKTGIDINPGATIGEYFCIDHGTGIVIGETAVLGHHVKLYQGVTIGARSFKMDENGFPVKGGKRHPNIGNNVVIYANATILGGDTFIPDNMVVGGNSWILHSPEKKD